MRAAGLGSKSRWILTALVALVAVLVQVVLKTAVEPRMKPGLNTDSLGQPQDYRPAFASLLEGASPPHQNPCFIRGSSWVRVSTAVSRMIIGSGRVGTLLWRGRIRRGVRFRSRTEKCWPVPGSTRLRRVVFGVAPKTSSAKIPRTGKFGNCVGRKFGRDARTRTPEACAPDSYIGVRAYPEFRDEATALCSAGFRTCCIADFSVGRASAIRRAGIVPALAGLETRDIAGAEACVPIAWPAAPIPVSGSGFTSVRQREQRQASLPDAGLSDLRQTPIAAFRLTSRSTA